LRSVARGAPSRLPLARRSPPLLRRGGALGGLEGRRDGAPRATDPGHGRACVSANWPGAGACGAAGA